MGTRQADHVERIEDRFRALPTKFDVHEWEIKRKFALSRQSDAIRDTLLNAIQRSGAFRNFKDSVRQYRMEETWYAFREKTLKQIAIDWCKENGLRWE